MKKLLFTLFLPLPLLAQLEISPAGEENNETRRFVRVSQDPTMVDVDTDLLRRSLWAILTDKDPSDPPVVDASSSNYYLQFELCYQIGGDGFCNRMGGAWRDSLKWDMAALYAVNAGVGGIALISSYSFYRNMPSFKDPVYPQHPLKNVAIKPTEGKCHKFFKYALSRPLDAGLAISSTMSLLLAGEGPFSAFRQAQTLRLLFNETSGKEISVEVEDFDAFVRQLRGLLSLSTRD